MRNLYEGLKILMKYHRADTDANELVEAVAYRIYAGRPASKLELIEEHYEALCDLGWRIDDDTDRWVFYTQ